MATALEIFRGLNGFSQNGSGWKARCPAHEDQNPSLSISQGQDGRLLVHCHAGCSVEQICAAAGLKLSDLFADKPYRNGHAKKIIAEYDYRDETGALLFQVCRFEPKVFRQRRSDGKAGWIWNVAGIRRVVYRLPQVLKAVAEHRPVFIVEGEKDADAVAKAGFTGTCNAGGAGKWQGNYSDTFRGAEIIIIADKDEPGRRHAEQVAQSLFGIASSLKVIELPDRSSKRVKDVSDWFAAGGEPAELDELAHTAREWNRSSAERKFVSIGITSQETEFQSTTADIRGQIVSVLTDHEAKPSEQRNAIAKLTVSALCKVGQLFFHAERRDFDSAMFFNRQQKRLERIRSDAFGAWLSDWLRINRADTLFKFAIAAVETAALSGSRTAGILPEYFWAARTGAIYLSNGDGTAARITAGDVATVDNGTDGVLFSAGRTLAPWMLTEPRDPFRDVRDFS